MSKRCLCVGHYQVVSSYRLRCVLVVTRSREENLQSPVHDFDGERFPSLTTSALATTAYLINSNTSCMVSLMGWTGLTLITKPWKCLRNPDLPEKEGTFNGDLTGFWYIDLLLNTGRTTSGHCLVTCNLTFCRAFTLDGSHHSGCLFGWPSTRDKFKKKKI